MDHKTCWLLVADRFLSLNRWIPETKGRSLEEMDIIFGAVTRESRAAGIEKQEKGSFLP